MAYETDTTRRTSNTPVSTGIPFWDMMFSLGKASTQVLNAYAPQAQAEQPARPDHAAQASYAARATERATLQAERAAVQKVASDIEVIPVGEETLNVGTRTVYGETTRVRRVVVETPVEQEVSLREERVIVERRKPTVASAAVTQGILTESVVEMSDSFEVVETWKSLLVTEEVVLRREATVRTETVRDTVRRDEVFVEQARPTIRQAVVETAQQRTAAIAQPVAQPIAKRDPDQLAADLKKVAERFEADSEQDEKAAAKAEKTEKADHAKAAATQHDAKATAAHNDKNASGRKA